MRSRNVALSGACRWLYTPAVHSCRGPPPDARQLSAQQRASPFLCQQVLQRHIVEHGTGQHALELAVLIFQRTEPLGFGHIHAAELGSPFVDAGLADTVLAAKITHRDTRLVLLQNADDLFFQKRLRFMFWSSVWARTNFKLD